MCIFSIFFSFRFQSVFFFLVLFHVFLISFTIYCNEICSRLLSIFLSINIGMLKKKNNGFVNRFQFRKMKNYVYVFFLCVVELFNIKQTKNETTRTIYYKDITIFICLLYNWLRKPTTTRTATTRKKQNIKKINKRTIKCKV